jgi:hypothetical protein
MGSLSFDGVRFSAYPNDHLPRHVHGFYGDLHAIVDLRGVRTVALAKREDATSPRKAKRNEVKRILKVAAEHFDELCDLWEAMRERSEGSDHRR